MNSFSNLHLLIEKNPGKAFGLTLVFLAAFQLISVYIGFELCDSGFYMTFYDNIFKAPEDVEYNFMFYLSGIIGGFFMTLFPNMGIFDMRLLGVVNNIITIYLLYCLLRKQIGMSAIIIGTIIVTISYVAMPMTFCYDLLTCLLYVLSILYLFKGLNQNNNLYLIISGIIIGLNVFVRIPNILGYGVILFIILYALYHKTATRFCIIKCTIFTLSFIIGVISVILFMKSLGHYEYFINNLHELFFTAKDDSGTSSHSLNSMILAQIRIYYSVLKFGIKLALLYVIFFASTKYIRKTFLQLLIQIIVFTLIAILFYKENAVIILCIFSMIGALGNIILRKNKNIKMLSWAGLFMMLVIPLGSDGGMYNNGSIIYWIAMPMAISFYISIDKTITPILPVKKIRQTLLLTLSVYIFVCGIKAVYDGVYFDGGMLFEKRYSIHSERTKHIYTSQERADIINKLLEGIKPYIQKDDYLFAYGSFPAINYMTHTRPFIGCSWPEMLNVPLLKHKIENYTGALPIILKQKFNSVGKEFKKPNNEETPFRNNEKDKIINDFIEKNNYMITFENEYFVLFLPQKEEYIENPK